MVLSDYAKGVLTPRVIRAVIDAARKLGKPLVVDPKGSDFSVYRGATMITPNRKELADATRRSALDDEEIACAATELGHVVESEAVLVTRSEDGMTLAVKSAAAIHVPAYPVKVRDVSGAGDTVVAVLAALLALGAGFEPAARAANAGAAVVVGKRGTATVSAAELRSRILPTASLASEEKIVFDWSLLDERLEEWRRHDLRIGFTNGCFDLLHPGHIKVLAEARAACDRLVVGLNSDASATRLKGDGRPIQNEKARAEVLAALEAVDLVVTFDEDTPLTLIEKVRPNVLVKGGDYSREEVVGRAVVEGGGGQIILVDIVPQHSTTRTRRAIETSRALARVDLSEGSFSSHAGTVVKDLADVGGTSRPRDWWGRIYWLAFVRTAATTRGSSVVRRQFLHGNSAQRASSAVESPLRIAKARYLFPALRRGR